MARSNCPRHRPSVRRQDSRVASPNLQTGVEGIPSPLCILQHARQAHRRTRRAGQLRTVAARQHHLHRLAGRGITEWQFVVPWNSYVLCSAPNTSQERLTWYVSGGVGKSTLALEYSALRMANPSILTPTQISRDQPSPGSSPRRWRVCLPVCLL